MKEDDQQELPSETREALIRSMNCRHHRICQKVVGLSEIKTETDRSLANRAGPVPVRMRSAQLSSLSYGSLLPKI